MSMFSRGSKKRKDFVEKKMKNTNPKTQSNYTDTEANKQYMKKKAVWAGDIIGGFYLCCGILRDPKIFWDKYKTRKIMGGGFILWTGLTTTQEMINKVMHREEYKNVQQGGASSKYLQKVQFEMGKLMATLSHPYTDPENFKSSMQSCGKCLSKLKHPIGSTALVKVGKKGERIVDYVDELARLMLIKSVQENAAILYKLTQGQEWPDNDKNYKYQAMTTKYVSLES